MADMDAKSMVQALKATLGNEVDRLVPWFYGQMPEYYFRTHSEEEQQAHLHAIVSGKVLSERQALTLRSPCGTRVTHILPGADTKSLVDSVASLADQRIQTARLYSSDDLTLRLDTFLLGDQPLCSIDGRAFSAASKALAESELAERESNERLKGFLASASEDYVEKFEPARAVRHFDMCNCVEGTEEVHVRLDCEALNGCDRIMVAMANPPKRGYSWPRSRFLPVKAS